MVIVMIVVASRALFGISHQQLDSLRPCLVATHERNASHPMPQFATIRLRRDCHLGVRWWNCQRTCFSRCALEPLYSNIALTFQGMRLPGTAGPFTSRSREQAFSSATHEQVIPRRLEVSAYQRPTSPPSIPRNVRTCMGPSRFRKRMQCTT